MKLYIKVYNMKNLTFIILLFFSTLIFAQTTTIQLRSKYNSLGSFWVGTYEAGVTYPLSDFQTSKIGYSGRAGFEYYFPSKKLFVLGVKLLGYYGEINGKSATGRSSGDGSLKRIIKEFNTPFVIIEPSLVIAMGKELVIPYFSFGASYILLNIPLEKNSYALFTNSKRDPFLTFSGEFGIKFFFTNNFSYNISARYFIGKSDEIDGFVSRKKDSFLNFSTGFSFHLFRKERIR